MRREFELPLFDQDHLASIGLPWETICDGKTRWLIIHDFPVPEGYNHQVVTAAFQIPSCYPDVQLDMMYFVPGLARLDGKSIRALSGHAFNGKTWQRWSRHRTSQNPWRPGIDDLSTHLLLVEQLLRREIERN